ncbi:MAG: DNA-3-methyladenine glycosylase family protein [Ilumatobacteraceae bacterium]
MHVIAPIAVDTHPLPQRSTLAPMRNGRGDPTTQLSDGEFWRATLTPDGPATLHLDWRTGELRMRAWGPGAEHVLASAPHLIGTHDTPVRFVDAHPVVMAAQHRHPGLRIGASRTLYHELLPTILAQRITAQEAVAQWRHLCLHLGDRAPGPHPDLRLPPAPERLAVTPTWWFHPIGVERKRAEALVEVARHARTIESWIDLPAAEVASKLSLLRGIGEWTIGVVLGTALGEPDAIAVGDFHLKNTVAWALAREPRADDDRLVALLEPYRGHRGRVVKLIHLDGHAAPKFGPRQRILPMQRW